MVLYSEQGKATSEFTPVSLALELVELNDSLFLGFSNLYLHKRSKGMPGRST